jgi:hypothetical protein
VSAQQNYWSECISIAAEDCDLVLTPEQLQCLAESAAAGHDHYSMAFYDPGWGDRMTEIENEWKRKYKDLEKEFDKYRNNAETAVKQALRQYSDSNVSIGENGDVFRYDGRTVQIQ